MGSNISLWVYRLYGKDLLYLEEMITTNSRVERKTNFDRPKNTKTGIRNYLRFTHQVTSSRENNKVLSIYLKPCALEFSN